MVFLIGNFIERVEVKKLLRQKPNDESVDKIKLEMIILRSWRIKYRKKLRRVRNFSLSNVTEQRAGLRQDTF